MIHSKFKKDSELVEDMFVCEHLGLIYLSEDGSFPINGVFIDDPEISEPVLCYIPPTSKNK